MTINQNQQQQYLQQMGIQVWVSRQRQSSVDSIVDTAVDTTINTIIDSLPDTGSKSNVTPITAVTPDWDTLTNQVKNCTDCELSQSRTQAVFGVGSREADWLIIGEAPGAEEDRQGEPFVGPAGKLLTGMLQAIGLQREQVYIANILKCRPPGNRDPQPEEVACCESYLKAQIDLIKPKMILALGRVAAQNLLKSNTAIGRLRGQSYCYGEGQIPLVVSYHPAYLLRAPQEKRKAWNDLKLAMAIMKESSKNLQ